MRDRSLQSDDRAVSIAVTHVLTVGITTILITGLLIGGSGLLDGVKSDATRSELRTIGNRMVSEVSSAYYTANQSDTGEVVVRASHPKLVAGNSYNVELRESCSGSALPNNPPCLVMQPPKGQNAVKVPLDPDIRDEADLQETTVKGGTVYVIVADTDGDDELEVTLSNDDTPSLAPLVGVSD